MSKSTDSQRPQAAVFEATDTDMRHQSEIKQQYWFERLASIGELGDVSIIKHKTDGSRLMVKTYKSQSFDEVKAIVIDVKAYARIDDASVLRVVDYSVTMTHAYCSTTYTVEIYLECFENSLESFVCKKQAECMLLSTDSLFVLLSDLTRALAIYRRHLKSHQCVAPVHVAV